MSSTIDSSRPGAPTFVIGCWLTVSTTNLLVRDDKEGPQTPPRWLRTILPMGAIGRLVSGAVLLLVEGVGIERRSRTCDAGQDRKGDEDEYDALHGLSPLWRRRGRFIVVVLRREHV